ncbi:unnamed protein product, partial [Prorocentrum cordatum]
AAQSRADFANVLSQTELLTKFHWQLRTLHNYVHEFLEAANGHGGVPAGDIWGRDGPVPAAAKHLHAQQQLPRRGRGRGSRQVRRRSGRRFGRGPLLTVAHTTQAHIRGAPRGAGAARVPVASGPPGRHRGPWR